jgi:hypothetical protein
MIADHKKLAGVLAEAEDMARDIYAKGARGLESTVRTLRATRAEVESRVREYERLQKQQTAAKKTGAEPAQAKAPTTAAAPAATT